MSLSDTVVTFTHIIVLVIIVDIFSIVAFSFPDVDGLIICSPFMPIGSNPILSCWYHLYLSVTSSSCILNLSDVPFRLSHISLDVLVVSIIYVLRATVIRRGFALQKKQVIRVGARRRSGRLNCSQIFWLVDSYFVPFCSADILSPRAAEHFPDHLLVLSLELLEPPLIYLPYIFGIVDISEHDPTSILNDIILSAIKVDPIVDTIEHDVLEVSPWDLLDTFGGGVVCSNSTIIFIAHHDELLVGCFDFPVFVEVNGVGVDFIGESCINYFSLF